MLKSRNNQGKSKIVSFDWCIDVFVLFGGVRDISLLCCKKVSLQCPFGSDLSPSMPTTWLTREFTKPVERVSPGLGCLSPSWLAGLPRYNLLFQQTLQRLWISSRSKPSWRAGEEDRIRCQLWGKASRPRRPSLRVSTNYVWIGHRPRHRHCTKRGFLSPPKRCSAGWKRFVSSFCQRENKRADSFALLVYCLSIKVLKRSSSKSKIYIWLMLTLT